MSRSGIEKCTFSLTFIGIKDLFTYTKGKTNKKIIIILTIQKLKNKQTKQQQKSLSALEINA